MTDRAVVPEKLGSFYLGREQDLEARAPGEDLVLYDANDLTTHGVCVGMTGSGKTGLCVTIIEEAALDGVPSILIDPKGDLGNLLLTFPALRPADFRPWIDEADAARKGQSTDERAAEVAAQWKQGLADWGQEPSRIARLRDAVEIALYTPGSAAGRPLTVLRSFAAPAAAVAADEDALRARVSATVAGLLALLGLDADPVKSREHVLLSLLLDAAWKAGRGVDLAGLIRQVQAPPFDRIGVLDLESFYPERERFQLALALNTLLASPSFAAWMTGEPLDVGQLLYRPDGRPRVSILSIAHLSEAERMFFVTLLLSEVVAWMRGQPGTSSLRALIYMDEVFGYLPPTANPPSKIPLLTLLKQARAYGLGILLATQNPVDLDYKALSNAGTWFIGRLQTERDKLRVMDGLEGSSLAAGRAFDRKTIDRVLGSLRQRVFLMSNAHDDAPVVFHTRWAMSYLRGPLTLEQQKTLVGSAPPPAPAGSTTPPPAAAAAPAASAGRAAEAERPVVQPGVTEVFVASGGALSRGERLRYLPALTATARLHHVSAALGVDAWSSVTLLAPLAGDAADPWAAAERLDDSPALRDEPEEAAEFGPLPAPATRSASHASWKKALVSHLYQSSAIDVLTCASPKAASRPGETEGAFRARLSLLLREQRDLAVASLEKKHAPAVQRLQERMRRAGARVDREKDDYGQQKTQTAVSVGATILGAIFGRKLGSAANVGRATTAMRGASRAARQREDIQRSEADVAAMQQELSALDATFRSELAAIEASLDPAALPLQTASVSPRKSDVEVVTYALAWAPWRVRADGTAIRAW